MSVLRQVAVHNFSLAAGLPQEMADEILGFCFYDTITALHRAVHRANMAEVVERFTGAWISRTNTPLIYFLSLSCFERGLFKKQCLLLIILLLLQQLKPI
uniref:Uncharacterized protein n=1 Tax=viral metagenome TaxID=1070528 RepID=A0A6C0B2G3_9ZZZZ